ncbi:MAG: hypothetical protein OHK0024_26450 [Thalassobaculales bacterium]
MSKVLVPIILTKRVIVPPPAKGDMRVDLPASTVMQFFGFAKREFPDVPAETVIGITLRHILFEYHYAGAPSYADALPSHLLRALRRAAANDGRREEGAEPAALRDLPWLEERFRQIDRRKAESQGGQAGMEGAGADGAAVEGGGADGASGPDTPGASP